MTLTPGRIKELRTGGVTTGSEWNAILDAAEIVARVDAYPEQFRSVSEGKRLVAMLRDNNRNLREEKEVWGNEFTAVHEVKLECDSLRAEVARLRKTLASMKRQREQIELTAQRGAVPLHHRLEAEQCIVDCERIAAGKEGE